MVLPVALLVVLHLDQPKTTHHQTLITQALVVRPPTAHHQDDQHRLRTTHHQTPTIQAHLVTLLTARHQQLPSSLVAYLIEQKASLETYLEGFLTKGNHGTIQFVQSK